MVGSVTILPPNKRGARTGHVQPPAFLEETGLDLTDRSSPEVQDLVRMIGEGEPVEEIDVQSDSLDEGDQIEAAILALRNEPPPKPARDDADSDAAVAQILRATARQGADNTTGKLSVVAAIRAEQEAEDADDGDDDSEFAGLDLREKDITKIGKLAPSAQQAIAANQGQHVVRDKTKARTQSSSARSAAKLYPDTPPTPASKEPIREPDPEEEAAEAEWDAPEIQQAPLVTEEPEGEIKWPLPPKLTPENPDQPPPQIVFVKPAAPQVTPVKVAAQPKPEPAAPAHKPQISAERKLARAAGPKTEAKAEQQQQIAHKKETLQSLLAQIETDDEPEPYDDKSHSAFAPPAEPTVATAYKLLFTAVIPKLERTLTQIYGSPQIDIWSNGNLTVNNKPVGQQLRATILGELNLRDR